MDTLPDQPKPAVPPGRRLRQHQVIKTVGAGLGSHYGQELKTDAVRLLIALQSSDPIEAIIDGLLVGSSNVAMKMLESAAHTTQPKTQAQSAAGAAKVIKGCIDLMTYRDQRRAGPQSVTVNAVKVEAGGQAIVGNVQSGKKPSDG